MDDKAAAAERLARMQEAVRAGRVELHIPGTTPESAPKTMRDLFRAPRPASPDVAEVTAVEMEAWGETEHTRGGFVLRYAVSGMGWGELTFVKMPDGSYEVDNETLSRPWIDRIMKAFLDQCILRDD
jgi:hypothetical protein